MFAISFCYFHSFFVLLLFLPNVYSYELKIQGESREGLVNVLDCDIRASEFELQALNYFLFRTNNFAKGMNPIIPPVMG